MLFDVVFLFCSVGAVFLCPACTLLQLSMLQEVTIWTHCKTVDTLIQPCIQHITNIPHSVLTRYVNAHSTLWHYYTDDHGRNLGVILIVL